MDVGLLDSTDPGWAEALQGVTHDVFHAPTYAAWDAAVLGGEAKALVAPLSVGWLLVPLVVRGVPSQLTAVPKVDGVSPYGYGCPLVSPDVRSSNAEFAGALIDAARRCGLVSLFLRSHPLIRMPSFAGVSGATVVEGGKTLGIALSGDLGPDSRRWSKSLRYEMRRLITAGFLVRHAAWDYLPMFASAYRETMLRRGASRRYLFDDAILARLQEALGPSIVLSVVSDADGGFAAGCLWTCLGQFAHYFLAATDDKHARLSPAKLLVAAAAAEAQRCGAQIFHLGGGIGSRQDSLFAFKSSFADLTFDFTTVRVVVDAQAYAGLEQARATGPMPVAADGFFPSYRAGLE